MRLAHLRPQEPKPPQRQDREHRRGPRRPRAQVPTQGQQRSSAHSPGSGRRAVPGPEGDGRPGWGAGGSAGQSAPWAPRRGLPGTAASQAGSGPGRTPLPPTAPHCPPTHLLPPPPAWAAFPGAALGGRAPDPQARSREEEEAREPAPPRSVPYLGAGARRGEEPTAQAAGRRRHSGHPARRRQARSYLSARRAACGNLRRSVLPESRASPDLASAATHGPEIAPHGVCIRPHLLPRPDFSQGETLGSRLPNS